MTIDDEPTAAEALRERIAKALYGALSPNFEITWKDGYYPAADAILALGEQRDETCDQKGRSSNDWPPAFERVVLSVYGPPVAVSEGRDAEA